MEAAAPQAAVSTSGVFDTYMIRILAEEGDGQYTDTPGDNGGPTKWGVTQARAVASGYTGAMRDLTRDQAMAIYRLFFWKQPMFDQLEPLDADLSRYALDIGINMGTSWPGHYIQRALNVLGASPQLKVDGVAGALTRTALSSYLKARGSQGATVLLDMVQAQVSVLYMTLAEGNSADMQFEYGWQRARAFGLPG